MEAARGEITEGAGDLLERPDFGNVGDSNGQRHASLEAAQRGRNSRGLAAIACRRAYGAELGGQTVEDELRPLSPQIGHKNWVL